MAREYTTLLPLRFRCSTVDVLRLEAASRKHGVSWMVRQCIAEYCEHHKIDHDPQLDERRGSTKPRPGGEA